MNTMDAPAPADKKGPPRFKQRTIRTFKSKAPRPGQKGFGDDIPGMEGLGTGKRTRTCNTNSNRVAHFFIF